ncbi:MAG: alginate lyase family protein, partial [Anaerolineae bacterium]|nr:alginate lyase family protein [Anaerolineae bacterium]
ALRALYDHAEFLYCFNVTRSLPTRLLNGVFLTLAGFYLTGFPVAEQWRLVGMTRLVTHLDPIGSALEQPGIQAARDIYGETWMRHIPSLRDEPLGAIATETILWVPQRARQTGLPLIPAWAEYYFHITGESLRHDQWTGLRIMTDEEFWQAIDLERPELAAVRQAVAAGDNEAARSAYTEHLARIATLRDTYFVGRDTDVNLTEADEICQDIFTLHAHMHHRHQFTDGVDWTLILFQDIESNVSLNYHYHPYVLAMAFRRTGDERYLTHLIRLLRSWLETSPVPDRGQPLLQWRTLEAGNRSGQMWPMILMAVADEPRFQRELLFDMARSYLEHGRYLLAHQAMFGNNWFQVESTGLGVTALLFPEFKESQRFLHCALRRLEWINRVCFLPDGFQAECSTTYHWFPLRGIASLYELAKLTGYELPDDFDELVERAFNVYVDIAQPDLNMPLLNDCSPRLVSVVEPLALGAKLFPEREDFRYMATRRREGKPPAYTSIAHPHAGYYISRSGWDEDALYTIFDAGYYGLGHQHEDKLNFVLYAQGRPLIFDPSIYQYKLDAFEPYWRGPRGHNAILVDGKGQNRRLLDHPEPKPDPDTTWITGSRFDFGLGWYKDGFATRSVGRAPIEADRTSLDRSIQHARALLTIKGEYVVLVDWILGDGEHTVEQVFHLAPIVEAQQADGVRPGAIIQEDNGIVRSAEPGLGNIALIPVSSKRPGVRIETGQTDPVRGWAALYGKQPAHDVTYTIRTMLPTTLPTVLWPQPPGRESLPQVTPVTVEAEEGPPPVALQIIAGETTDLIILATQPTSVAWSEGTFTGQMLWVRYDASGAIKRINAARASQLTLGGEVILPPGRTQTLLEQTR